MKYRMYHLVMYNISPIQQGIQAYHAGMEYAQKYWDNKDFRNWLKNDKTVILLNGGTSHHIFESPLTGTMEQHETSLEFKNIKCASFNEPDLNDSTSAIAFLVDERVWDKETYPDYEFDDVLRMEEEKNTEQYYKWVYLVGGEKNVWLREFLSQFKLA